MKHKPAEHMTYMDLIGENFDTPERERSYAEVKQIPHMSNLTYFYLLLLGGFPLFILFELARLSGWYLYQSFKNGRPCRLFFPKRSPDSILLQRIKASVGLPEPQPWETDEQRQLAETLANKFVSPALRPYVRPDTPLCLLNIRDVFMFLGIKDYEWGTIAKEHRLGQKDLNRIHRLLNASPHEAHTFHELVSMIRPANENARENDDFGCLLRGLPILFYFPASILIYACTHSYVITYGSPTFEHYISSPQVWLGFILFPFQYIWFLMWAAIWPGC